MNSEKPENIKTSIDIHEAAWILAKSRVPRSVDSVDLMGAGQHWVSQTGTVYFDMGVSENSVPLNPMVNDHYPYKMAIIGNIPYFQTNPYHAQTRPICWTGPCIFTVDHF